MRKKLSISFLLCLITLGVNTTHGALGDFFSLKDTTVNQSNSQAIEENIQQTNQCIAFEGEGIGQYCGQNPLYIQAKEGTAACQLAQQSMDNSQANGGRLEEGAGITAQKNMACFTDKRNAVNASKKNCESAMNRCAESCRTDYYNAQQAYHASQQKDTQAYANMERYKQISNTCVDAYKNFESAATQFDASIIGPALAGLASVLQALGVGNPDEVSTASLETNDDEKNCDGEWADLLIECQDNTPSDPGGTRAGLGGTGTLIGKPGLGMAGIDTGSTAGEPGGSSKDDGSGSSGSGFNSAGLAGGVSAGGSASGSSGTGGGEAGSGLDTDINKGSYGGFGGGGGGSSGGGSSSGRSFGSGGNLSSFKTAGMGKAALNKKLNQFKSSSQSRNIASDGAANGPFEDNWSVVNKAYKKNSSSLFHKP